MSAGSPKVPSTAWEASRTAQGFPVDEDAPRHAREAMSAVGIGLPSDELETARLLVSGLVTNSVRHSPRIEGATVGVFIGVDRDRLRVEVSDGATEGASSKTPTEEGGYGLALMAALATRWGGGREGGLNVTWFELDLPSPGS